MVIAEAFRRAALQVLISPCFSYLTLIESSVVICCLQGLLNGCVIEQLPVVAEG